MENNRNLFLTIGLSVAILALWQIFFINPRIEAERQAQLELEAQQQTSQTVQPGTSSSSGDVPTPAAGAVGGDVGIPTAGGGALVNREAALAAADRIVIDTPTLHGSLNLQGARFDDLTLADYRETVDPNSPEVVLLSPFETDKAYFAEFGYTGLDGAPGPETVWSVKSGEQLTPTS
ncbi:MAG: membrane protein insertase YidC, partial [Pseudomonadota bacterium]